jgi:hypothetical protein
LQGRRISVILGIIVLVAIGGLGGWQWWRWRYPSVILDPNAEINPDRTYRISIWVEIGDGLVEPPRVNDEFWAGIEAEFQSFYPNVQILLEEVTKPELEKEMHEALARGRPPHILVTSSEWFRVWSDLQLPIDRFLPAEQRYQYFPGALARVTVDEHLVAWPSQIQPSLWVASQPRLQRLGNEMAWVLDSWGEATSWFGNDWRELKDKLRKLESPSLAPIAHQLGDPNTLTQILVATSKGIVGPDGQLLLSGELIRSVLRDWQVMQNEKFMSLVQGTLLTDFLSGKRVIIGPVGLWIWSLGDNARLRRYRTLGIPKDMVLLPAPGAGGSNGYLNGKMVDVIVFRHQPFQGSAHARLSMELAKTLSRKLGVEMSKTGLGVPACKELLDEWQSIIGWGPEQRTNLEQVLERSQGLPPLPLQWHEARRQLLHKILLPNLADFVNGKVGPEIADKLEMEMRLFLEALQPPGSKGKDRPSRITYNGSYLDISG